MFQSPPKIIQKYCVCLSVGGALTILTNYSGLKSSISFILACDIFSAQPWIITEGPTDVILQEACFQGESISIGS